MIDIVKAVQAEKVGRDLAKALVAAGLDDAQAMAIVNDIRVRVENELDASEPIAIGDTVRVVRNGLETKRVLTAVKQDRVWLGRYNFGRTTGISAYRRGMIHDIDLDRINRCFPITP